MAVYIDEDKCRGCAVCVAVCPVRAVSVIGDKAVIDRNLCTECLRCLDECPENAVYQVLETESRLAERPASQPASTRPASLESGPAAVRPGQEQVPLWKDRGFLEKVMDVASGIFRNMSSYGGGKRGGGGKHGGGRKGYRGGRGRR